MHSNELRLFWATAFPLLLLLKSYIWLLTHDQPNDELYTYSWEEHVGNVQAHDCRQVGQHDQQEGGVTQGLADSTLRRLLISLINTGIRHGSRGQLDNGEKNGAHPQY